MNKYIIAASYKGECGVLRLHRNDFLHFLDDNASVKQEYSTDSEALSVIKKILNENFDKLDLSYWEGATKENINIFVKEMI